MSTNPTKGHFPCLLGSRDSWMRLRKLVLRCQRLKCLQAKWSIKRWEMAFSGTQELAGFSFYLLLKPWGIHSCSALEQMHPIRGKELVTVRKPQVLSSNLTSPTHSLPRLPVTLSALPIFTCCNSPWRTFHFCLPWSQIYFPFAPYLPPGGRKPRGCRSPDRFHHLPKTSLNYLTTEVIISTEGSHHRASGLSLLWTDELKKAYFHLLLFFTSVVSGIWLC